ncbi:2-dehydro-3-deoxygluconokinase [Sagittula marina]|uniref:2-dehydro-3-deoxygluconokinase n=1 Tax=Sagittula marina TaxID=943940 RepID=A0A7W6DX42_9RHOB|nr:sugar kinase [Sagittula marina]MBB3988245.1 2-dehydro-3-deoxygluconokinase [Sagittula marina]
MAVKVAFAGEAMIEMARQGDGARLGVAGDVYNSAVYLRRLMPEADVRLVTALGDDPYSNRIAKAVVHAGLSDAGLRRVTGATCGLYAIDTDDAGERRFTYWRSVSAARGLFSQESDFDAVAHCDVVVLSGITLAIMQNSAREALVSWLTAERGRGGRVAFDSNYRPALWSSRDEAATWCERLWRICDFAFPSVDDEQALFGDASRDAVLKRFIDYGVGGGALKAGAEGAFLLGDASGQVPTPPVARVVDTTAAGDSFNAGFLAAALRGAAPEDCARAGHALAGKVIQHRGAILP